MTSDRAAAPLVSVLIPVYNAERYLARCLDSVLSQDYPNIEVVAVDDGSRDGSPALLDAYSAKYPGRVRVEHRANGGVAAARNRAIELAAGEYLMFSDNDDYFEPGCVTMLVDAALDADADLVCAGFQRPDKKGAIVDGIIPDPSSDWAPYAIVAAWAKIFRTAFVREHGLAFFDTNIGEDLVFTLPAVELSRHTVVLDRVAYNWFYNTESVSSTAHRTSSGLAFEKTLDALIAELKRHGLPVSDMVRHYLIRFVAWYLMYTCRGDGAAEAARQRAHYIAWLDANLPGWRRDPYAKPSQPASDALANRVAVWLFARHPRLFALAQRVYCR